MKLRILILVALFAYTLGQSSSTTSSPTTAAPAPTTAAPAPTTAAPAPTTAAPAPTPTTAAPAPTTAAPAPTPTTAAPAPTTAAPAPTTAVPAPTPTTAAPAPTTAAPTQGPTTAPTTQGPTTAPTTQGPTTAAPTQGPTTAAPTAAPATTTVAPPKAKLGKWGLKSGDDYCVVMQAQMTFYINYMKSGAVEPSTAVFVLDDNANVTEYNCSKDGEDVQLFTLTWNNVDGEDSAYVLNFTFTRDIPNKKYSLSALNLTYTIYKGDTTFPDAVITGDSQTLSTYNENLNETFLVKDTYSYKCFEDTIELSGNDTIHYENFQFQAFSSRTAIDDFGNAIECDGDFTTSDIVPIAVGCALAALVVIVLIAYLIGRKRSRQKGYQSV